MIGVLKPYPEYASADMPWMTSIPKHWNVRRMKFLFSERVQKGFPDEPLLAATQTKGVVRKETYGQRTVTASKDFHLLKLVEQGDFVISLRSFEGGIEIAHDRGIISPAYTVLRPRVGVQPGYYSSFLKSKSFIAGLTLFVTGIREGQNIDYVRLSRAYLPLPPEEEQLAIGKFLHWAGGRLERAIRAKRKVIALLNEQKQAIIHRAVTRGLDPSVPLKPSGVPWLGEIPQHWEFAPIKRLLSLMDYGTSERCEESGTIRVLTMGNIQDGEVVTGDSGGLSEIAPKLLLDHHDLLFTRTNGNPDLVGKVGIFRGHREDMVSFASYLVRLRVRPGSDPRWLHMLLNSAEFWRFARSHALVNLQTNLNSTRYGRFLIPVPSMEEQQRIVGFVNERCAPIERMIHRLRRELEVIREFRASLIANVVTGKLDVREATALLPESEDRESSELGEIEFGLEEAEEETVA